ncbi:hypothetical protein Xcel_2093 [Xylanimonas cellulosilytica DSM 15894]|uniref:Uncharacterized protein n=1 Tax=Xylanimonas cellulosilytica (strain DSM 15894 / JCM 12276 / CECT 5975 / KCTC 9989 / LMG 20990 / NBRC 107835 / XIL07) TaxID=446471 RepID=D1BU98_XYLCX|nr:hypothetical protein [Xylanimonas cellulosilytica]ACZ31111.1 hypothetical protein Xcel_2093 [Xylanimonas cellulosilytica DSM 15894]
MREELPPPSDRAFREDSAALTYFYLRVGIIVLVGLLTVAVLREDRAPANGVALGSISASWYTPVQSVFVAVLVGAGAAMVALRGRGIQEPLLNLAGLFAPVVAFVPTPEPVQGPCFGRVADPSLAAQQTPTIEGRWNAAACAEFVARVDGAIVPYFWVGSVALVATLVYVVLRKRNPALVYRDGDANPWHWFRDRVLRDDTREPGRGEELTGVVLALLIWAAVIVWYGVGRDSFVLTAHAVAASFVFLPMTVVALLAGRAAWRGRTAATRALSDAGREVTAILYVVVAAAMLIGVAATAGARVFDLAGPSSRWFWGLEWVLVLGFLGFWCIQTFEARIPRSNARVPAQTVV